MSGIPNIKYRVNPLWGMKETDAISCAIRQACTNEAKRALTLLRTLFSLFPLGSAEQGHWMTIRISAQEVVRIK